jgi:hypothetical protein
MEPHFWVIDYQKTVYGCHFYAGPFATIPEADAWVVENKDKTAAVYQYLEVEQVNNKLIDVHSLQRAQRDPRER